MLLQCPSWVLNSHFRGWVSAFCVVWSANGAMCEIYSQTKSLISSLGSDYKASDNGDGERLECHRYIYHRIMDTIMSTQLCFLSQSEDAFTDQWQGWTNIHCTMWMRGLYRKSRFHEEMLFDELWSSIWWHLGSTLRKETRAPSLQSQQSWAGNGQF